MGFFSSEETNGIDLRKRYGDVPEGIDQFGGENIEREGDAVTVAPDVMKLSEGIRFERQGVAPGIDQFGAEGIELEDSATKRDIPQIHKKISVVKMERYKDAPVGIDQFGGEGSEGNRL